jgi:hypothetical protein
MFQKGDLIKPVVSRRRFGGGTLALLLEVKGECNGRVPSAKDSVKVLWLNGRYQGQESLDYDDLFAKVEVK